MIPSKSESLTFFCFIWLPVSLCWERLCLLQNAGILTQAGSGLNSNHLHFPPNQAQSLGTQPRTGGIFLGSACASSWLFPRWTSPSCFLHRSLGYLARLGNVPLSSDHRAGATGGGGGAAEQSHGAEQSVPFSIYCLSAIHHPLPNLSLEPAPSPQEWWQQQQQKCFLAPSSSKSNISSLTVSKQCLLTSEIYCTC